MGRLKKLKKIRIHREGTHILWASFLLLLLINAALYWGIDCKIPFYVVAVASIAVYLLMVNFFRCPIRLFGQDTEKIVVAPADGKIVVIEDVMTSGKALREVLPKLQGAAKVNVAGMVITVDRMEKGLGGEKSALEEIREKYGFETNAIVTMEEVVEHLYNRTCQGRVVIDDTIKAAIDDYYKQYGCN